jgi:signal transduction histidine kinase
MNQRAATGVVWVLVGLAATVVGLGLGLAAANGTQLGLANESLFLIPLAVGFPLVGALVASRRPHNGVAWVYLGGGLGAGLALFAYGYAQYALVTNPGALPGGRAAAWVSSWVWVTGATPILTFGLLLFPDGRLPSPRWRLVAWLAAGAIALPILSSALMPGPFFNHPMAANPVGIPGAAAALRLIDPLGVALFWVAAACSVAAVLVRFRRGREQEQQQLKWLAFAMAVLLLAIALYWVPWLTLVAHGLFLGAAAFIPVAIGIAILRYRLFDIDLLINRTLVYTALTVVLGGAYVGVVAAARLLLQGHAAAGVSVAATALVAVLFAPLRSWLQRRADQLLYGDRHDPHAALSRLGRRLEATMQPEAVLPSLVETVAESLRLPYVAIELAGEDRPAASHGHLRGEPVRFPLVYQGEVVGQLTVGPRSPGEALAAADLQLLEDLAGQVGVAVHAVRLTADLQRSRQRLVSAREEERRRLRRDLHDGLGSALAGLALQVGTARAVLRSDPTGADAQLARLECGIQALLVDIRRLVYALRPPALDELGLVGALRQQAATFATAPDAPLQVQVDAADELPPLPAAVEVAAYRIATEAITNVSRHAHARTCTIRLVLDGNLQLEVRDDGAGLPAGYKTGIGLASLRERAAELGGSCTIQPGPAGGTRVLAHFPVPRP